MVKEVRDLASSISLFNAIRFSIKIEVLESYTTPGVYILDVHKWKLKKLSLYFFVC